MTAEATDATLTEPAPTGARDDLATGLRDLLDGSHADVRRQVLAGLTPFASVLDDADTMSHDDFRERVRDVLSELTGSGLTGLGFPKEYGGGGHIGASIAA